MPAIPQCLAAVCGISGLWDKFAFLLGVCVIWFHSPSFPYCRTDRSHGDVCFDRILAENRADWYMQVEASVLTELHICQVS